MSHITSQYHVVKHLASGGMADVFLARHLGLANFEKWVVIKRILPKYQKDPKYIKMFLEEAKIAACLSHPNIAQVFEIGQDEEGYFLVMEFLTGKDLGQIFTQAQKQQEAIPLELAIGIAMEVALGLDYAHHHPKEIIHKDISPNNILLTQEGGVKILDFGIAQIKNAKVDPFIIKGKQAYMSPEQALGEPLKPYSDQYSLGVILYELTTLKRFNPQTPPGQLVKDYPKALETIILKCLQTNPTERFHRCSHLARALEQVLVSHGFGHSKERFKQYLHHLLPPTLNALPLAAPPATQLMPPTNRFSIFFHTPIVKWLGLGILSFVILMGVGFLALGAICGFQEESLIYTWIQKTR